MFSENKNSPNKKQNQFLFSRLKLKLMQFPNSPLCLNQTVFTSIYLFEIGIFPC